MTDEPSYDQRGQRVIGAQINVAGDAIIPPAPPVFVPHLPSPPRDFTGRDEELSDLLAGFDRGTTITGLYGMSGIGKTALAYALAEKLTDRYPDGQILVELRGTGSEPMTSAEAMTRVVRAYYSERGQAICYKKMNDLGQATHKGEQALKIFEQIESPSASTMRELSNWRSK
jgi:ABC-type multidrug transport system ATPase subunit